MTDIENWIESRKEIFTEISDRIFQYSELGLFEKNSSELHARVLGEAGFQVERGVAGLSTAIRADFGSGSPVVAVLGEYDALPGLSQAAEPVKKPVVEGGAGHGCGHNLFGTAGIAACMAIREKIERGELLGTIRYYGCPAEENANGKEWMVKEGVFDDVDVALTWHPADINSVVSFNFQAMYDVVFRFNGRSAHAAGDPHNGRSALDAVELMNVGCNYLREHIIPGASIHYTITRGGEAPNIVPADAEVWYFVRAPRLDQAREIYDRVVKVARGAAMMTETEVEPILLGGTSNLLSNITLEELLQKNLERVGAPSFTDRDRDFAGQIQQTLPDNFFDSCLSAYSEDISGFLERFRNRELCDEIVPIHGRGVTLGGSTDVGGVSWVAPLGQFLSACYSIGTPGHSWQLTAQAGTGVGHRGMLQAAKVLGLTAADLMEDPGLVEKAAQEFREKTRRTPFLSPLDGKLEKTVEYFRKLYRY